MATLKISDLSVGDWVHHDFYEVDMRVKTIYGDTERIIAESNGGYGTTCHLDHFTSIPITPAILEANGFEEHCGGIFRYEWMWQGESSGITLCSFDEELWFVDLFFKEGKDIMCNIPTFSVHQLQHILRLAGVEKEIVMPNK